ncbi:MAG: hypothetical protein ACD_2C00053G0004 [uncultured bacterium (gcode 4)]|uniref:PPM-type phosphatase domain-containing protein n=1 Tax=uncultured bacterium (gcode 4) TaxID=1234023 RepID=K2G473_9BACT|nr:MAG: hypothetical protein ACD_2C00053G0004 [uncultured bacterium (gcode 4)]
MNWIPVFRRMTIYINYRRKETDMKEFEFAQGSMTGREHRRVGKNNQDACEVIMGDDFIIATVCDGCSDAKASEVGANLICRMLNARMAENIQRLADELALAENAEKVIGNYLENLRVACIDDIIAVCMKLNANYLVGIKDFFLSTVVSVIVTREIAFIACIGDGVIVVNGEPYQIGPFPDNEPPYIAYGAVDPAKVRVAKELYRFNLVKILPSADLNSVLIGSDGVEDIISHEFSNIPGKDENVGNISQFWDNPKFFSNVSLLSRKLNLFNTDSMRIDWETKRIKREPGLLPDDTTMVVVRRKA